MKKLMIALVAIASFTTFAVHADEAMHKETVAKTKKPKKKADAKKHEEKPADAATGETTPPAEAGHTDAPAH